MSQDQPSTKNSKPAPKESAKSQPKAEHTPLPYLRNVTDQEEPRWQMSQFSPFDVYQDMQALITKVNELQTAVNFFIHNANTNCNYDCTGNKDCPK